MLPSIAAATTGWAKESGLSALSSPISIRPSAIAAVCSASRPASAATWRSSAPGPRIATDWSSFGARRSRLAACMSAHPATASGASFPTPAAVSSAKPLAETSSAASSSISRGLPAVAW